MSTMPRLHAVHDDGDRTVYLCRAQGCDSESNLREQLSWVGSNGAASW